MKKGQKRKTRKPTLAELLEYAFVSEKVADIKASRGEHVESKEKHREADQYRARAEQLYPNQAG